MKIAQIVTLSMVLLAAPMVTMAQDAQDTAAANTFAKGWVVKPGFANIQYGVPGVEVQTTVGDTVYKAITDYRGVFEFPDIIPVDECELETVLVTVRDSNGNTTNSSRIKTNVGQEDPQLVAGYNGWTGQKTK